VKLPWGGRAEAKCARLKSETALALIQEEQRTVGAQHHQILAAGITEIREDRGGCRVENAHSRVFGNVCQGSIATIPVEAIGETARLADVDLVLPVSIDVADRDTVVPMDIDSRRGIETRPPVGYPVRELRIERRNPAKGISSDIAKQRRGGGCECLFDRLEVSE